MQCMFVLFRYSAEVLEYFPYLTTGSAAGMLRGRVQNPDQITQYLPGQEFLRHCHMSETDKCGKSDAMPLAHTYQVRYRCLCVCLFFYHLYYTIDLLFFTEVG